MGVVPSRTLEAIQFCEDHYPNFLSNAANLGLTAAQATAFKNTVTGARTAFNAQQTALDAARAATLTANSAVAAMRTSAGDTIRLIRAFAETQTNPNTVYSLANIPAPAQPAPRPAPGTPDNFKVELNNDGSITLKWRCRNPAGTTGTVYHVSRRIGGTGEFTELGTIGTRAFTDDSVPSSAATQGVVYIVQAQRGDLYGQQSLPVTVTFGQGGGGLTLTLDAGTQVRKVA